MATSKKAQQFFTPDYSALIDEMEKSSRLTKGAMSAEARRGATISTGLLGTDIMLGGGLVGGRWYTILGPEGSAKSSHLAHIKIRAADYAVPIQQDYDFEGSSEPAYVEGIMRFSSKSMRKIHELYGLKDDKNKVIVPAKVRYYNPDVAEDFFNPVASLLRKLPDKIYVDGKWWYVWDNDKFGKGQANGKYSKVMYSKHGRLFVEAENGLPQALFYPDSYPAMFPEELDEDDKNPGMAAVARAMSANIPKILPKLRRKNVSIVGVNQLRLRPAVRFQNPEYEPGGEAIKFASSVRIQQRARSVPHGKGPIEKEQSVFFPDREDTYRYVHMKAIKNKVSTPYLESWQRVWVDDGAGGAHGFCPAYDTVQYLKNTGQATGNMKKIAVDFGDGTVKFSATWQQFKTLVLKPKEALPKVLRELKLKQDPKLRERCFHQMKNGDGLARYFESIKSSNEGDDNE